MGVEGHRIVALIPAKGGSTRLPRKNIIELCGKPLLAWTIEAAQQSGICDDIVVSTEDEEIAGVARQYGASVPFMRDVSLAVDPAGVEGVSLDAIDQLESLGERYTHILILLPTSPLRTAEHIRQAYEHFQVTSACSLMSVSAYDHSPFSAYQSDVSGLLEPIFPDKNRLKSQELPKAFRCNGAIHLLDIAFFKEHRSYTCSPLTAFEMDQESGIDIDTQDDLDYAHFKLKARLERSTE